MPQFSVRPENLLIAGLSVIKDLYLHTSECIGHRILGLQPVSQYIPKATAYSLAYSFLLVCPMRNILFLAAPNHQFLQCTHSQRHVM